jgi:hypothetical protein
MLALHGAWLARRIDGSGWHLFSGDLREMVDYINELHRRSGVQHAARELDWTAPPTMKRSGVGSV